MAQTARYAAKSSTPPVTLQSPAPPLVTTWSNSNPHLLCPCVLVAPLADLTFLPCPCKYKVCLYCFNKIKEQGDKKCPACRQAYGPPVFQPPAVSPVRVEGSDGPDSGDC